ncbi:hypothetical protein CXZ05_03090 [Arthrobacter sp. AFG20]|nr:hypothetical protein CXZ05_03090 [Arthrobacter sp. AFG20]
MLAGVGEDSLLSQILRPTQRIGITRLKGVADDVYVLQGDRWITVRTYAAKHMTQGKGRAGIQLCRDHGLRRHVEGRGSQIRHWNTLCH